MDAKYQYKEYKNVLLSSIVSKYNKLHGLWKQKIQTRFHKDNNT